MTTTRKCGACQLCCKLLPVPPLSKGANQKCPHQRAGKGCMIYGRRPHACAVFSCGWLADPEAGDLRRPDRSRYLIDPSPEFIRVQMDGHAEIRVPAVQVWCDPTRPDAHRDPQLRDYLERKARRSPCVVIIRYGSAEGVVLFPPAVTEDGCWHERDGVVEKQHSAREIYEVIHG